MKILVLFMIFGSIFLLFKMLFSGQKPEKIEFSANKPCPEILGKSGYVLCQECQPQTNNAKNLENENVGENGGTFAAVIQSESSDRVFDETSNELDYSDLEIEEEGVNLDIEEEELRQMFDGEAVYSQGLTFEEIQKKVKNDDANTLFRSKN
ncbi:MAG: hypothetical protein LBN95_03390 [Prevotellaceae bacterium]|jgi:hypothetical protein|nr:hypothetical protein [Prevotellaceae bacterium]